MKLTGHKLKKQREGISYNVELICGILTHIFVDTEYFCQGRKIYWGLLKKHHIRLLKSQGHKLKD